MKTICVSHEQAADTRSRPEFREWRKKIQDLYATSVSAGRRAHGYAGMASRSGHSKVASLADRYGSDADEAAAAHRRESRLYEQAVNRAIRDIYGPGHVACDMANPYGEDVA